MHPLSPMRCSLGTPCDARPRVQLTFQAPFVGNGASASACDRMGSDLTRSITAGREAVALVAELAVLLAYVLLEEVMDHMLDAGNHGSDGYGLMN